jgi:catechol 2,3-dioxygenase-like lactoylglutathione lyase family enzyme
MRAVEESVMTASLLGPLWNIGCKTADVRAEVAFLERLGAHLRLHETLPGPSGPIEYAILELGGTRILLTPTPVFEGALAHELRPGLTHAVFEVDDHDAACEQIARAGARPLTVPRDIEAGFGRRRVAFFESPGGLVFEALKINEARI